MQVIKDDGVFRYNLICILFFFLNENVLSYEIVPSWALCDGAVFRLWGCLPQAPGWGGLAKNSIFGSNGGCQGCAPHLGVQILSFPCSFRQKKLAYPLGKILDPPLNSTAVENLVWKIIGKSTWNKFKRIGKNLLSEIIALLAVKSSTQTYIHNPLRITSIVF